MKFSRTLCHKISLLRIKADWALLSFNMRYVHLVLLEYPFYFKRNCWIVAIMRHRYNFETYFFTSGHPRFPIEFATVTNLSSDGSRAHKRNIRIQLCKITPLLVKHPEPIGAPHKELQCNSVRHSWRQKGCAGNGCKYFYQTWLTISELSAL